MLDTRGLLPEDWNDIAELVTFECVKELRITPRTFRTSVGL